MHLVTVNPGDSIYVPPGLPHAIGAGVFIVEVQEPEDMSILLEWKGFAIDGVQDGHIGLGFPTALRATDRSAFSIERLNELIVHGGTGGHTLAPAASEYFRAERFTVEGDLTLTAGFGTLVFLSGAGTLAAANGSRIPVQAGETVLTAFALGELRVTGPVSFLRCRPPQ
jgi:mannose-6-phosphate isomerase